MSYVLAILLGYFIGSVPFALVLGRLRGVDVRTVGTANPGAANLFRRVSRPLGVVAAALDGAKGALAVLVGNWLGLSDGANLVPGAAAVVGHWYPLFFRFRGGEGLATAVGVGLGTLPLPVAMGLTAGGATVAMWRNVGGGAGVGWAVFVSVAVVLGKSWPMVLGLLGLGGVVLVRSLLSRGKLSRGKSSGHGRAKPP